MRTSNDSEARAWSRPSWTNEQMWGQDLTKVPGFEEATVKNLTNIRENGALAAYKSCL